MTPEQVQTSTELMQQSRKSRRIDIVFENVAFSVKVPGDNEGLMSRLPCKKKYKEKTILKEMSGIFKAGKISAIMGASGAGKTTLLNILACRIKSNSPQSKLYANSLEYNYDSFGDFANYVMQQDILTQTMTVREILEFTATLKVNKTEEERKLVIDEIVQNLKLEKCLDTLIGGFLVKGISGGEKKRVSIAVELISDPQVLFLDEPTSGLDSLTSYIIVLYLNKLAKERSKTVIMTIHQPNSETYEIFDNLTVLLQGRIVYQAEASKVTKYFLKNFNIQCPQFVNAPDFFMSKIHFENEKNKERYPEYFSAYEREQSPEVQKAIEDKRTSNIEFRDVQVSFWTQLIALMKRDALGRIRNPLLVKAKLFLNVFLAPFIGGIYFNAAEANLAIPSNFSTIAGFSIFVSICHMLATLSPVSMIFPIEKVVYKKEQDSKLYSISAYYFARNTMQIPELLLIPLIAVLIYYWMIGLALTFEQFFSHLAIAILLGYVGSSFGMLLGSMIMDAKDVAIVVPIFILPSVVFSGYFKNREDLPDWAGWYEYLSPIKYGFSAILQNEVEGRPSRIDSLNFDVEEWPSIWILLGMSLAYRTLTLLFLWLLKKKHALY